MPRILVTGGCGFIGSHTVLLLLERGYEVIILDSNSNSSSKILKKILNILELNNINASSKLSFFKGDIRDEKLLDNIFKNSINIGKEIDGVIHFSGMKSVKESKINAINYWDVNVSGSINLVKVMDKHNCRKLVFSSSASVYGNSDNFPFKEDCNPIPLNPYANTKLSVEKLMNDIFNIHNKNWNILCLRYFNPIGAHESGIIGEEPLGIPNNIFPLLLRSSFNSKNLFNIYGNDWPTHDGTCIRDYIHIEDLAEGHIAALDKIFDSNKVFLNLNLGTGRGTSVLELIKVFEEINKVKISYKFSSRREGDCPVLIADNSNALSKINWRPKRNLEDMCRDGFNWFQKNSNIYTY